MLFLNSFEMKHPKKIISPKFPHLFNSNLYLSSSIIYSLSSPSKYLSHPKKKINRKLTSNNYHNFYLLNFLHSVSNHLNQYYQILLYWSIYYFSSHYILFNNKYGTSNTITSSRLSLSFRHLRNLTLTIILLMYFC
jgi:hypothetical protein